MKVEIKKERNDARSLQLFRGYLLFSFQISVILWEWKTGIIIKVNEGRFFFSIFANARSKERNSYRFTRVIVESSRAIILDMTDKRI